MFLLRKAAEPVLAIFCRQNPWHNLDCAIGKLRIEIDEGFEGFSDVPVAEEC